jgi:hypothetical protein
MIEGSRRELGESRGRLRPNAETTRGGDQYLDRPILKIQRLVQLKLNAPSQAKW